VAFFKASMIGASILENVPPYDAPSDKNTFTVPLAFAAKIPDATSQTPLGNP